MPNDIAGAIGAGFLGGIVAGFLAGYVVLYLNRYIKLGRNLDGLKPVLILPLLGTTIVVSTASDHGLWGVAAIAGEAAGLMTATSLPERAEDRRHHDPDPSLAAAYDRLFDLYESLVQASRPIWDVARRFRREQIRD